MLSAQTAFQIHFRSSGPRVGLKDRIGPNVVCTNCFSDAFRSSGPRVGLKDKSDLMLSAQTAFQIHSGQAVSERRQVVLADLISIAGTNIMFNTVNKQKRKENKHFCWFKRAVLCPVGLINLLLRLQSGRFVMGGARHDPMIDRNHQAD